MDVTQDLFISHAGADKTRYIEPLSARLAEHHITFWLDNLEISWGDSVPLRINEGLRQSRFLLLCLSPRFLGRKWPEAELGAALAVQTESGQRRVLPLILEGKEQVLAEYPLLAGLSYREYTEPDMVANELAAVIGKPSSDPFALNVVVESVHTGRLCNLRVARSVSVRWLTDQAQRGLGVKEAADTGAYMPFLVRWVLVDQRAEQDWSDLPRSEKRAVQAIIKVGDKIRTCLNERDRLSDLGIDDGIVFHMYAIEDERFNLATAITLA